ncbi:hypothetical protein C8F04DRAFT_1360468 [Mycena alexandri]|uniref:BTB domain-containing protein n=1 Tax=Mycena alexandri TaxID=1745969 RepID=A0AAD6X111_9AGAR|nr:hypothetical protein C8F04DRAFT_1360468 [Mycena alexandri]
MTDSATGQILQEVEGLWFPADLVILQAGTRIFRVFTTILKEKSPIFADMFAIPQPSDSDVEKINGVPVVKMPDDPDELEFFLKAIFDSDYFMPPPAMSHINIIIGVLRLAHKYDVSFLRRRALQHLCTVYCTRLEDYRDVGLSSSYAINSSIEAHLKTIQISVEVGALWMLPHAYYSVFHFGLQGVLAANAWKCLGESERAMCLRLFSHKMQILPTAVIISLLSMGTDTPSFCTTRARCNQVRLSTIQDRSWDDDDNFLNIWDEDNWTELKESGLCSTCLEEAKAAHEEKLRDFWNTLPTIFDLPDWATLEEMRSVALA